jgi:4-amino-4-deoxy-L-arabinose transferase-like glycosyltransferase
MMRRLQPEIIGVVGNVMMGDSGASVQSAASVATRLTSQVLLLILVSTLARLCFASSLGLGIDEAYMVAAGRELHLSYFDHPPISWWLAWGASHLFGGVSPLEVRAPFILIFALTTWLIYRLGAVLFGERAGLWSAIMLNLSPVFAVSTGSGVLPDGPLMAAMLAAALCLAHLFFTPGASAVRGWLGAGLFGGLALLSKYHGIFVFAGGAFFVLSQPGQLRWIKSPWPYLGALLGLVIFSPVLVWNAEHHWVSFLFQAARSEPDEFNPLRVLIALGGQALYVAPWIWMPLVFVVYRALKVGRADPKRWLLLCLAAGPILVFSIVPAWSSGRILPHWAAPGYLMLFPLLGAAIAEFLERPLWPARIRAWALGSAGVLFVTLVLMDTEVRTGWIERVWPAVAAKGEPLQEVLNWTEVKTALADRGFLGRKSLFVTAPKWHEAGKIGYVLGDSLPVLCLSQDPREFGALNRPEERAGDDALIIGTKLSDGQVMALYGKSFGQIEMLDPIIIRRAGRPVITLSVYYGHRFDADAVNFGWYR